jgi:hypothetical protein
MDEVLNNRWLNEEQPFDGITLYTVGFIPLEHLRNVLLTTIQLLCKDRVNNPFFTLHDWHEHDGVILPAKVTTWKEIIQILESEDSLYESSACDTYVSVGIYPEEVDFYLRYYIPEPHDCEFPGKWGQFDITCTEETADNIREQLSLNHLLYYEHPIKTDSSRSLIFQMAAKAYFDRGYAG